ncbi:XdhC family protein [Natrinema gelatinilyticum]|uniref:XdhC family protein n=1 Tax=Natrinema gelatinilyticum TaxID=2961571 RepID=UPI0020C3E145|nr:XdhC family protein [Natrinema gelatinilyticum]
MESDWSVPEADVIDGIRDALAAERSAVLVTIVDIEGSAYRRPGAKMIIDADGDGVGNITAGCLEDEVRRLAAEVLDTGEPRVETYDLMNDEDDVWGLGVGCNGIIDVLLEPIDESFRPVVEASAAGEGIATVTILDGDAPAGARAVYRPDVGFTDDENLPEWIHTEIEGTVTALLDQDQSATVTVETAEGTVTAFVDVMAAPPELVVLGSGPDIRPVTELANNCDFRVTVVAFRGAAADPDRFPHADEVLSTSPADLRSAVEFNKSTYAVLMTHNFVDDRLALEELLATPVPYVGLLGPRDRFEEVRDDMATDGVDLGERDRERIYTPVGLDLGSGTPYGIAHSIVAELLAVHNDRDPKHVKEREGPIHPRIDESV